MHGYCPICGSKGVSRERRINGNDTCENGHVYPSVDSLNKPPKSFEDKIKELVEEIDYDLYKDLFIYQPEDGDKLIEHAKRIFYVQN